MRSDRGAVTAELAVLLPVVVALLAVILSLASAASAQMRCADAARAGARAAALGDDDSGVSAVAGRVAGPGAAVAVSRGDGWVVVEVERSLTLLGLRLGLTVHADATAREEP
ncbi:MAG TPA: TadE family type IV pilus minor pilin [Cellulomonas sp.]